MCGIVGYIGGKAASPVVMAGLKALEYRGYDSAGIALLEGNNGTLLKQVGRVDGLQRVLHASPAPATSLNR